MLKYFAALGSWAGNENNIEKLLTLIFYMNSETHKGVYCLKSSLLAVRYLTEVFSGVRGGFWMKRDMEKNPATYLRAFKLWVQCMDLTPWFWRILAILWRTSWVLASCLLSDLGFFEQTSDFVATSSCPEFSIAQGGNIFSFEMRISGRGSALKQSVLNSGVEVILYNVYMGQCFTIGEIYMLCSFFLIFMWPLCTPW